MTKTVAFRPTEKAEQIIRDYKKEHNIKSSSKVLNEIIENSRKVQLEQNPKTQIPIYPEKDKDDIPKWQKKELEKFFRGEDSPYLRFIFSLTPQDFVEI